MNKIPKNKSNKVIKTHTLTTLKYWWNKLKTTPKNWKIYVWCSWIGRFNVVKMFILLKAIYRFKVITIKYLVQTKLEQAIVKVVRNYQRSWIAKAIIRKNNKAGRIMFPHFQLLYKGIVNRTTWLWHKQTKRYMEQNREPRNKHTQYNQLIYDKGSRIYNGKHSCFIKLCWETYIAICKRGKLHHFLTLYTKSTQKGLNT